MWVIGLLSCAHSPRGHAQEAQIDQGTVYIWWPNGANPKRIGVIGVPEDVCEEGHSANEVWVMADLSSTGGPNFWLDVGLFDNDGLTDPQYYHAHLEWMWHGLRASKTGAVLSANQFCAAWELLLATDLGVSRSKVACFTADSCATRKYVWEQE